MTMFRDGKESLFVCDSCGESFQGRTACPPGWDVMTYWDHNDIPTVTCTCPLCRRSA